MKRIIHLTLLLVILLCSCAGSKIAFPLDTQPGQLPYKTPWIVAHRGARSVAPENTLLSAERAYAFGADQWELDVRESKDGVLIVIHDDSLARTSNVETAFLSRFLSWKAKDYTIEEIQALDAGSWYLRSDPFHQIREGNISPGAQDEIKGATFPTLAQALQFTQERGWSVNVEIKDLTGDPGDVDVVEKTVALIESMGMQESVIISSFNMDYLVRVKQAAPDLRTAALVKDLDGIFTLLEEIDADAVNPHYQSITNLALIRELREAGYDVYVWTVNDPQVMLTLINAGVSGIITDFPQVMAEVLARYD